MKNLTTLNHLTIASLFFAALAWAFAGQIGGFIGYLTAAYFAYGKYSQ